LVPVFFLKNKKCQELDMEDEKLNIFAKYSDHIY